MNYKIYKNIDLVIIFLWSMVALIIPGIESIPLVLFFPGYLLLVALFPRNLESATRIGLSLGLSIVVISMLGILLNFTIGLRLDAITFALLIYIIIFVFIIGYRRRNFDKFVDTDIDIMPKDRKNNILFLILIFAVLITIGLIYYTVVTPSIGKGFTEFYILNSTGKIGDYSNNEYGTKNMDLSINVVNHEHKPVNYTVQIVRNNNILINQNFSLKNNEKWNEKTMLILDLDDAKDKKLNLFLYKENNFTTPYRHLWVNI